jgi:uncharacterized protein
MRSTCNAFLNGYLFQSGDYQACRLLRLYAVHRALVRAKVAALRSLEALEAATQADSRVEHGRYVTCARTLLVPGARQLVLTCGLSGSGKTWLAARLAPRLGAVHVRSDVERKRVAGLTERERSGASAGEGPYSVEMNDQVYQRLYEGAVDVLGGGMPVIVDATFQRRTERARFSALAARCAVALYVILCDAPQRVLEARITGRQHDSVDASEADLEVLRLQRARFEPIYAKENLTVIDADTTQRDVLRRVLSAIAGSEVAGR